MPQAGRAMCRVQARDAVLPLVAIKPTSILLVYPCCARCVVPQAKCEAPIRVELIDRATGQPISEDLPDVVLEVRRAIFIVLVE